MAELIYKEKSVSGTGGAGKPFKANGVETDTIAAGDNIVMEQIGNVLTISAASSPASIDLSGVKWE